MKLSLVLKLPLRRWLSGQHGPVEAPADVDAESPAEPPARAMQTTTDVEQNAHRRAALDEGLYVRRRL